MSRIDIFDQINTVKLVPLSTGYRIKDFSCEKEYEYYEYFLKDQAISLSKLNVSKTHLLINKENADIIAFMSILCSQIKLHEDEKPDGMFFATCPVLKIGQLAVDKEYNKKYKNIGTLMVTLARGIGDTINSENIGVACRYIVVDANIELNPSVATFYEKIGFMYNNKENGRKNLRTISMRLEI